MYSNQNRLSQPSGSIRSTSLPTATGHPNHSGAPVRQIDFANPLHTLKNPSKARAQPYLYSSRSFPTQIPPSTPKLSSSASTPSHTIIDTTTLPPVSSMRTPSTRHSSLRPPSTRLSPAHPSSITLPRDDTRTVPSKRAHGYTTNLPTLYHASSILPSSERPAKRPRLDVGCPALGANPSRPKPRHKKAPLHPLAVDYGRPIQQVIPQPPFCRLNLRQNRVPLPPYPENPDPKRLLEDELRGPVDPTVAKGLGDLVWMRQKRVWLNRKGYYDPFLGFPILGSLLDTESSSSCEEDTPAPSRPETITLYGPPPRNNELIHLGERLANPNTIVVDDDEDGGFEEVLDLYRAAVQGSALSMELELAAEGDPELMGVSWEAASSLEISIGHGSGEPPESRIRTLAEYREVVEAENVVSLSEPAIPREEPPLGIEWSYSCCGYAAGKVVNIHSANTATASKKRHPQP